MKADVYFQLYPGRTENNFPEHSFVHYNLLYCKTQYILGSISPPLFLALNLNVIVYRCSIKHILFKSQENKTYKSETYQELLGVEEEDKTQMSGLLPFSNCQVLALFLFKLEVKFDCSHLKLLFSFLEFQFISQNKICSIFISE